MYGSVIVPSLISSLLYVLAVTETSGNMTLFSRSIEYGRERSKVMLTLVKIFFSNTPKKTDSDDTVARLSLDEGEHVLANQQPHDAPLVKAVKVGLLLCPKKIILHTFTAYTVRYGWRDKMFMLGISLYDGLD